ncbi:hypothetical protein ACIQ7D_37455 [Streptomyces sp. NPDC096310]|uniref:hypothetical protein n=1 Tax=Streptomyces sp. NPDC096310 TaxID=3366082 RepID=UPI0038180782
MKGESVGKILGGLSRVRFSGLRDANGPAGDIPSLLSKAAWGDVESSRVALDEISDRICSLGFVVSEATAPTVPFILELAGSPQMQCKVEVLELLLKIYNAEQWSSAAEAARPEHKRNYESQVCWESMAHAAVLSGRHVVEALILSSDQAVAQAARALLSAFDGRDEGAG